MEYATMFCPWLTGHEKGMTSFKKDVIPPFIWFCSVRFVPIKQTVKAQLTPGSKLIRNYIIRLCMAFATASPMLCTCSFE